MSDKEKKPRKAPEKKATVSSEQPKAKKKSEKPAAALKEAAAPKKKTGKAASPVAAEPIGQLAASDSTAARKAPPTHAQVAERAHHYFVERGHRHGFHEEDWLRAERDLRPRE